MASFDADKVIVDMHQLRLESAAVIIAAGMCLRDGYDPSILAEMAVKLKMNDKELIDFVRKHGATDFKSVNSDMAGEIVAELETLCKKTLF